MGRSFRLHRVLPRADSLQIAGKQLTGTVRFPAAPGNITACGGNPGIVFSGTFGGSSFRVTQSCSADYKPSYTGQIGGLAVHGTYGKTDGPADLGYPESIMHLTGSFSGHDVTIQYPYPDAEGGESGKAYTTVATISVSP